MRQARPLLIPLAQIGRDDLALVGGKGANLGELTRAGFPVPPGFCLTTAAFRQFVAACPEAAALYALLDTVTTDNVAAAREVGRRVRQALLQAPIPRPVADAIRQQWQQAPDLAYAVRSSATAEDLPHASFAGQQDTYLNIRGEADLLDAVRRCWVSLFTDRAILYRRQHNFSHRAVQLSVVVQQMVMADVSGVLFTADPLTGHRHTVTIDASFGLGEALVSGLVSPDAYRVDKRSLQIVARQIADKQVAVFPDQEGGIRQEALDADRRSRTALTDAQVLDLARLGSRVEAHYGAPQDIEWALAGGRIYLLQARPVTSLYPMDPLPTPDDGLHIYFSAGHQQMMTNAMSPLSLSSMRLIVPVGHAGNALESSAVHAWGGRLYLDITQPLRHPVWRQLIVRLLAQFDALAPQTLQMAMARPEFQRPHGLSLSFSMLRGLGSVLYQVVKALGWQDLTGSVAEVNALIAQQVSQVEAALAATPPGQAQIRRMVRILPSLLSVVRQWAPWLIAGEAARRLLVRVAGSRAVAADLEAVGLGLPGNVVTEMNLAVGDLADTARRSPQLVALFARLGDDSQAWLAQAARIEDSGPFLQAWTAFLARYGARGPAEIDIQMPRWYEEPLPLLQVIAGYLQKEAGSHRRQHRQLAQARAAAAARLLAGARRGPGGRLRQRVTRRLIYVLHHGSVLREHHKFMLVQHMGTVKEALKENGRRLAHDRRLAHPDDIWFLSWPELLAIWEEDAPDLAAAVPGRRADLARYQKLTPPLVITSDGETPVARYQVADAPPGALVGNPVSPGLVTAAVRVIRDPYTETIHPGEILVAPFTDPGWTPLFINASGLIMEVGGNLTHGSVVAREYGIPAVVGVRGATDRLRTGQQVRLDGNRGIVEIL